jgi:hypothetical protein
VKSIYLAHPLSDDPVRNQLNASRWGAWIAQTFGCRVSADWIWMTQVLEETSANRRMGLACDCAAIERCDELWLVGGFISSGMNVERVHARDRGILIRDLTSWGYRSPAEWPALLEREDVKDFIDRVRLEWRAAA